MSMLALKMSGTSPRMRGKLMPVTQWDPATRNIPAYAGKTYLIGPTVRYAPEHPRVCGENFAELGVEQELAGTSPRMRGKHYSTVLGLRPRRNIPAYAGKTECHAAARYSRQEHPRVCGENAVAPYMTCPLPGTSPRMRGKQWNKWRESPDRRNIPAYAGKTHGRLESSRGKPEHPRVCGENTY